MDIIESRCIDLVGVKILQRCFDVGEYCLPIISARRAMQICMIVDSTQSTIRIRLSLSGGRREDGRWRGALVQIQQCLIAVAEEDDVLFAYAKGCHGGYSFRLPCEASAVAVEVTIRDDHNFDSVARGLCGRDHTGA